MLGHWKESRIHPVFAPSKESHRRNSSALEEVLAIQTEQSRAQELDTNYDGRARVGRLCRLLDQEVAHLIFTISNKSC